MLKFLCDQMLANLARWLRAAGYDTEIAKAGAEDREILEEATREDRHLLTCDRHFLEMNSSGNRVVFFQGKVLEEHIQQLSALFDLNWLYHPFSRCLVCNTLLTPPDPLTVEKQVPAQVRSNTETFRYCKNCDKIYWEGTHTSKMLKQLSTWQQKNLQ